MGNSASSKTGHGTHFTVGKTSVVVDKLIAEGGFSLVYAVRGKTQNISLI
jgi:hypothetical protein